MMKQRGPLIAGIAGAIALILFVVVMIMPKVSQIHDTKDQLASAQDQEQALQTQLTSLEATEKNAKAIRTELDLLDAAVPTEASVSDLIRMLNDTADQAGVDFMSVSPGTPTTVSGAAAAAPAAPAGTESPSGEAPSPSPTESTVPLAPVTQGPSLPAGVSVIPTVITVNGSYFAVDEYLFRLESLPRISKVTQIGLVPGPTGYPQLALTLTVNFYTTDVSAGPGSEPGPQTDQAAAPSTTGTVPTQPGAAPVPTGTQAG
jgi:Tfp pilus assembly protein PilO